MNGLDALPQAQPMNPLFEPAMIGGDDEEQDDESGQHKISGAVPTGFVERDDANEASHENGQPPFGEAGTGACSASDEPFYACDQALQLCRAGDGSHFSTDLT